VDGDSTALDEDEPAADLAQELEVTGQILYVDGGITASQ
jgi:hypothetical protein